MAPTAGKLEMIGASDSAEHDAIKTLMVFEAADDPQTETAAIPGLRSGEIANRPGYPQMVLHQCTLKAITGMACRLCGRTSTFLPQARLLGRHPGSYLRHPACGRRLRGIRRPQQYR